jgi:PAS domain S-box-containing protein
MADKQGIVTHRCRDLPIAAFLVDVGSWQVRETSRPAERLLEDGRQAILDTPLTAYAAGRAAAFDATLEEMATVDGTSRRREQPDGERLLVRKTGGKTIPVEVRARQSLTSDGDRLVVVMRDISREVQQDRRLHAAESAVEHAFDAIYVTDERGVIQQVNGAFESNTGYAATAVRGQNASTLEPGIGGRASFVDRYETASDGDPWTVDVVNERASGEQYTARRTVAPLVGPTANPHGFVVVQRDRTESKLRRQQLDVFHRVLRHDLRNAVTVVQGHAERILEQVEDDQQEQWLRAVRDRVQSLHETSEKAQRARKVILADGERSAERELASVLSELTRWIDSSYPNADVELETGLDEPVRVDGRVRIVLRELVENALEHTDTGPGVSVSIERDAAGVTVAVADNGPGIADEDRRLLEAETEAPLRHASGLGLWLVDWIVSTLGGRVDIDAAGEEGTTVSVRIPTVEERPLQ